MTETSYDEKPPGLRYRRVVEKAWGREVIFADEPGYCGKVLEFNAGSEFSMHFHREKDESWYVVSGSLELEVVDPTTTRRKKFLLTQGDTWRNPPGWPHKLRALEPSSVVEASTRDDAGDNYRIEPGDSQRRA